MVYKNYEEKLDAWRDEFVEMCVSEQKTGRRECERFALVNKRGKLLYAGALFRIIEKWNCDVKEAEGVPVPEILL